MNPSAGEQLQAVLRRNRRGETVGVTSVCSAHPEVLRAALKLAKERGDLLLIEATCNQVNQFGGYTGETPAQFTARIGALRSELEVDRSALVIGGDHIGPNPWRNEPVTEAMDKARRLVRECAQAGYQKIHLDASMPLGDDVQAAQLPPEVAADRGADLAAQAELELDHAGPKPLYVIGTEVPIPGGAHAAEASILPSTPQSVQATLDATRLAFSRRGLRDAWQRVIAMVAQPGVEFGPDWIHDYQPPGAKALVEAIEGVDRLVYEAHSTDYQLPASLAALVRDHFAILKVGPALTFGYRQALFALEAIERELLPSRQPEQLSGLSGALEAAMRANPEHWRAHVQGGGEDLRLELLYSFSDRCRYYWSEPRVEAARVRLLDNLGQHPLPLTLISQHLPVQYEAVRGGQLAPSAPALIEDRVRRALTPHLKACTDS